MASRWWTAWLPALFAMVCLGGALALAAWASSRGADSPLSRPALFTLLAALTIAPVGVSLLWSMGLRYESIAFRLIILIPIGLSVVVTVALMLDTHFRGSALVGPAGPGAG